MGLELVMDEGGGAFYGPKISVQARDAIGRTWQMSTVQLDFQLPQRFGLEYVGADNARHRPIMIHRALFGSVERFMAVLIEHYAGALPTWLCPEQVRVIPVTDAHAEYAAAVADGLRRGGIAGRGRRERREAGRAIRQAKMAKIPYVLVVGDDDVAAGTRRGEPAGLDDKPEQGVPLRPSSTEVSDEVARKGLPEDRAPAGRGAARRRQASERGGGGEPGAPVGRVAPRVHRRGHGARAGGGRIADDAGDCVFCRLAASGPPSEDNLVVWRGELTFVVMNAYPYASGHVLVLPLRHVGPLGELTEAESAELWCGDAEGGRRDRGGLRARRAEHGRQSRACGRGRASRSTCTCTCCPAGRVTPTS